MKKTFLIVAALVSFTTFAFAGDVLAFDITIDVAPNILNLQRTDDKCVTVHTDIPFNDVNPAFVSLAVGSVDIFPYLTKSDLRGDLVAKFWMANVRELELEIDKYNTFTLTGKTIEIDGVVSDFSGSQDIWVQNNIPSGRR